MMWRWAAVFAVVGAQAGVPSDLPGGQMYLGAPAVPRLEFGKSLAKKEKETIQIFLPDYEDQRSQMVMYRYPWSVGMPSCSIHCSCASALSMSSR